MTNTNPSRLLWGMNPNLPGIAHVTSGARIPVAVSYDPPLQDSGFSRIVADVSGRHVVICVYPASLNRLEAIVSSLLFRGKVPDAQVWGLTFFSEVDGTQYTSPDVMDAIARALSKTGNLGVEMLLGDSNKGEV